MIGVKNEEPGIVRIVFEYIRYGIYGLRRWKKNGYYYYQRWRRIEQLGNFSSLPAVPT